MSATASGKKILIVDDEKSLVEFIESVLVTKGHKVSTAYDGQEALRKLSHGDPDLMLLDVSMPKMGGMELYSQICTRYGRSRFPVIVLTALDALTDFFEEALVDRFVTKPFKVKELLDTIDLLLTDAGRPQVWIIDSRPEAQKLADGIRAERFNVKTYSSVHESLSGISAPPHYVLAEAASAQAIESSMRTLRSVVELKTVPVLLYSRDNAALSGSAAAAGADGYVGDASDLRAVFTAMRRQQKNNADSPRP